MVSKGILTVLVIVLICGTVSAFSLQGFVDWFAGLFKAPDTIVVRDIVCNPPYIMVSEDCCLDQDIDMVCDKDETTTSLETTTTLVLEIITTSMTEPAIPTTTEPSTTTITLARAQIACRTNADCGQVVEEAICKDGDVYKRKTYQLCTKPGTYDSECVAKTTSSRLKDCGKLYCIGGECFSDALQANRTTTTRVTTSTSTTQFQTTSTQPTATTQPVFPGGSCGDGVLDLAVGEECDGVRNSCPKGLTCQGCICVGCGDGRLQNTEECEPYDKVGKANGKPLWSGQAVACGANRLCDQDCRCVSSVVCKDGFYGTDTCSGECAGACGSCKQYQSLPCYFCENDCGKLGPGWGDAAVCSTCDVGHQVCKQADECSGCYHCVDVCPVGQELYKYPGCDGKCDNSLCTKVSSGQYRDCYQCKQGTCGDKIKSNTEECETDSDCESEFVRCEGCKCVPDCQSFCDKQGVNGYQLVNKGQSWTPQECNDWKLRKFQEISAAGKPQDPGYCKTTCIYSAQYSFNDYGCCCVDWNQLPCQDCPCTEGKNCPPKCPLTPECLATL